MQALALSTPLRPLCEFDAFPAHLRAAAFSAADLPALLQHERRRLCALIEPPLRSAQAGAAPLLELSILPQRLLQEPRFQLAQELAERFPSLQWQMADTLNWVSFPVGERSPSVYAYDKRATRFRIQL